MAAFTRYEEIEIWRLGRDLVKDVYEVARRGAFAKDWGLRDQIQRAAVSICSNVAEGFERRGNKEFIKFLWIAKGSAAEVSSQLYHAKDFNYISNEEFDLLYAKAKTICAKAYKLIEVMATSKDYLRIKP